MSAYTMQTLFGVCEHLRTQMFYHVRGRKAISNTTPRFKKKEKEKGKVIGNDR